MTLAVGVRCPWPDVAEQLQLAGVELDNFVVLASDSRWSKRINGRYRRAHDRGRKLYEIDDGVAVVFSGDVLTAYDGIGLAKRELKRIPGRSFGEVKHVLQRAFSRVHKRERARLKSVGAGVDFLVALGNIEEGVKLVHFGSRYGFQPIDSESIIDAYGHEEASFAFARALRGSLRTVHRLGQLAAEPSTWGIAVSSSLNTIVQSTPGSTIGGKVQLGIMHRFGFQPLDVVALRNVAAPPEEDTWDRITVDHPLEERPRNA